MGEQHRFLMTSVFSEIAEEEQRGNMEYTGVWGPVTSSVDWCEPNYVWSPYVAEWWNTMSNIFPIVLAVTAMIHATRKISEAKKVHEPVQPFNVMLAYLVPITVFSGSFAFHATLTYFGQLLDELPMVYGALYLHYLMCDKREFHKSVAKCAAVGFTITALMFAFPASPLPLQLSYVVMMVSLLIRSVTIAQSDKTGAQILMLKMGWFSFGTGFVLWLIDQNMCKQVAGLYFHAWWHMLTGVGTYLWIQFAVCLHQSWSLVPHTTETRLMGLPFVTRSRSRTGDEYGASTSVSGLRSVDDLSL